MPENGGRHLTQRLKGLGNCCLVFLETLPCFTQMAAAAAASSKMQDF